jgi:hypothetical protein
MRGPRCSIRIQEPEPVARLAAREWNDENICVNRLAFSGSHRHASSVFAATIEPMHEIGEGLTVRGKHQQLPISQVLGAHVEQGTGGAVCFDNNADTVSHQTGYRHDIEQMVPRGRLRPDVGTKPVAFGAGTGEFSQEGIASSQRMIHDVIDRGLNGSLTDPHGLRAQVRDLASPTRHLVDKISHRFPSGRM